MNAYVQFKPSDDGFHAQDFAHRVKENQGNKTFEEVLRRAADKIEGGKKLKKTLKDASAMYLYGGRKALIREFDAFRTNGGDFTLTAASGKNLAVFHGKVTTVIGNKTKRILMIANTSGPTTPPKSALNNRRLKIDLPHYQTDAYPKKDYYGYYTHLDLAGLRRLVVQIPD